VIEGVEIIGQLGDLRARIAGWKRSGLRIALVPTMGNLHAGHFSLVDLARRRADRVVASVFVNPTQFGPNEDFERYPRTPETDAAGLATAGCDAVWMPSIGTMYPLGIAQAVRMHVPGITDVLDGAHRPGHFDGVATVVSRLFNQVQPDAAVFGRKDYQQFVVLRHLVEDLAFPVEMIGAPIVRESDGLAMSSRNQYLSAQDRAAAPAIHHSLLAMRDAMCRGEPLARVEADAVASLQSAGFDVDYATVRRPGLLEVPAGPQPARPVRDGSLVALVAARIGRTRLIDNLEFSIP